MMVLVFTTVSFAQQVTPNQNWKDSDLCRKSKSQKTIGWIMAGAGTTGFVATLVADGSQVTAGTFDQVFTLGTYQPEYKSYKAYYVLSGGSYSGRSLFII